MGDQHAIIHLGELTKPAAILVEKICDGIGGLARPWQIKRVAEAEAEAVKIHAIAEIKVTELQKRAMTRLIAQETRQQNNMESITAQALPQLEAGAKPENIEDDWITTFFDKCRLISDEEMQKLWAKVLAGEANSPGNFSKRTISTLATLDKSDARLFSKLCSFSVFINGRSPLIYNFQHQIYKDQGINFGTLSHLESIGLIYFGSLTDFLLTNCASKGLLFYFDQALYIEFPKPTDCAMNIGRVRLTQVGEQLAAFCEAMPVEGFVEYVRQNWKDFGYKTEPSPGPPQF